MAASFPRVTVLIFLEIVFSENLFGRSISWYNKIWSGLWSNWYWYYKYLTDGERWQLRSPGLRCWYFLKYYFPVCICSIAWYNKIWSSLWRLLVLILQIFNDGERWQLRSPGLRYVLIFPEVVFSGIYLSIDFLI